MSRPYKVRTPKASVTFNATNEIRTYSTVTPASASSPETDTEFHDAHDGDVDTTSPTKPPGPGFSGGLSKRPRSPGSTPEKATRHAADHSEVIEISDSDLAPKQLFPQFPPEVSAPQAAAAAPPEEDSL